DLTGVVHAVGGGADSFALGDEVLGWSDERSSQAELVAVPATQLTPKPSVMSWEAAGSLFVAGTAALASVEAVAPRRGETVVVSAAAGGVGSIAVQLAVLRGATVIGLASERHHEWLRANDIVPVAYGDGQAERITAAAGGVDAFMDTFGGGYVDLALDLGVAPERINTIIDFAAAQRHGCKTQGTYSIASAARLAELAEFVADGKLDVAIAGVYPLDQVRDAYRELESRHTLGKIVLVP
ncbi:MAG: NADP-dependent oxidoreductase, partial [Solirubrobacteraceae bacterium]